MPDPVIIDWPLTIVPSGQVFYAPGQVFEGGFTGGGAEAISPEPGGRAYLEMSFNTLKSDREARLASWLYSKAGSVFRVPLYKSVQLVSRDDLPALPASYLSEGVPWQDDSGGDVLWGDDVGWGVDYGVYPTAAALEGQTGITIDMSVYGRVAWPGHVIGYKSRAYKIDTIEYDENNVAVASLNPPLRTDIVVGDDAVTFRPSMLARMLDPSSFRAMFDQGKWVKPGNVIFGEVLL